MDSRIDEGILEQFQLPKYINNRTFAEAAETINKKFGDRADRASMETKEELLSRLADAQEFIKEQEQQTMDAMNANSQEVPDMMDGQIPEGGEEYMEDPYGPQNPEHAAQIEQQLMAEQMGGGMPEEEEMMGGQGPMMASGGFTPQSPQMGGARMPNMNIKSDPDLNNYNSGQPMPGLRSGQQPNLFKLGGILDRFKSNTEGLGEGSYDLSGGASGGDPMNLEGGVDMAGGAIDLIGGAFGRANNIDTSGASGKYIEEDKGMGAASGALKGVALGAKTGNPFIAAGAGVVGGLTGLLGAGKANREMVEANLNADLKANSAFHNTFPDGGSIFKKLSTSDVLNADYSPFRIRSGYFNKYSTQSSNDPTQASNDKKVIGEYANKALDWTKANAGSLLQTAPILHNLTHNINKAPVERGTRLGNRYEYNPIDREGLANQIKGLNTNRAISEMSGGNQAAAMANMQGSQVNRDNALSNAYLQHDTLNARDRQAGQQFNAGIDQSNVQMDNQFLERKEQTDAAYNTARAAKNNQLATDIGRFGKELTDKGTVGRMFGYSFDGKYLKNPNGESIDISGLPGISKNSKTFNALLETLSKAQIEELYKTMYENLGNFPSSDQSGK